MKKITEINKPECRQISTAAAAALIDPMEALGLKVKIGGGRYSQTEVSFKVTFILEGVNPEKELFLQTAEQFGVKPDDYGRVLTLNQAECRLVGVRLKAPKYPFILESLADGRRFYMQERPVLEAVTRSRENLLGQDKGVQA